MTITQTPLEKQLVNIDLGKGVDEQQRPELMGGITALDNLVQDQTGAWRKRDGYAFGPASDASGTNAQPLLPKRVMALVDGWGVVADGGRFYHKMDAQAKLRARQYHMDFSATSAVVAGSSGAAASTACVVCSASSTLHDAAVVLNGNALFAGTLILSERSTGAEVTYNLGSIYMPSFAGYSSGTQAQMCFVGDRYLHLFTTNIIGGTSVMLTVIDTQSALPLRDALTSSAVYASGGGAVSIKDVVGGTARSWVLIGVGTNRVLYAQSGPGVALDNGSFTAGHAYDSMDADETHTNLWLLFPGATTRFIAVDTTNSASVKVASFTSANPGTYISCNTSGSGSVMVVYQTTKTFGGTTIAATEVLTKNGSGGDTTVVGAMYGWSVISRPFFMSLSARHYMHMVKQDTTSTLSSHVVVDLSTFTQFFSNTAGLALPYGSFRIAASVEPYAGIRVVLADRVLYVRSYDGIEAAVCVPYQTAQRVNAITFHRLRLHDSTAYGVANFSGSTYMAHGGLNAYDGYRLCEQGLLDQPTVNNVVPAATPGLLSGSYRYVAVYRHVDANGTSSYSRTYGPVAAVNVAASTGKNNLTIQSYSVTNRDDGTGDLAPFVELYRTKSGGTQYYLCASSQLSPVVTQPIVADVTTGLLTVQDNMSDTTLASQAIMYRQPGTTNSPADRYAAPACKYVVQHKDRLFCSDPYGLRVYYSSFFVDGEAAWFNPTFNFFLHAGSGPVTAIASMDGRLFVFKKDAIFAVDGDGPGEAGPSGNEFSPPQSLASRYGCIDHRSVVVVPDGIIYRSTRGIELLTRNLQVKFIGGRVFSTVDANPVTTGACVDSESRIHITLAASEGVSGIGASNGAEVVYDIQYDCWSVSKFVGYSGFYGRAVQGVAFVLDGSTEKRIYADAGTSVYTSTVPSVGCLDSTNYVPFKVETGWIKQGPQARQRISDVLLLAKKQAGANHALKISLAYDYSTTYTQTSTWEPSALNTLGIEELNIQPSKQQVLAIRVKIEDQAPADIGTYPIGTGAGCDILSITAEVASKQGAPRLAAGQKA